MKTHQSYHVSAGNQDKFQQHYQPNISHTQLHPQPIERRHLRLNDGYGSSIKVLLVAVSANHRSVSRCYWLLSQPMTGQLRCPQAVISSSYQEPVANSGSHSLTRHSDMWVKEICICQATDPLYHLIILVSEAAPLMALTVGT